MAKKQEKSLEIPQLGQANSEKSEKSDEKFVWDPEKLTKGAITGGAEDPGKFLEQMTLAELLELRADIDKLLPARKLSDLDLEEEVLLQFALTKDLYNRVQNDRGTPANQRAQVANSCTTILDQLIKMQARLYSAERVKAIETALTRTLRELGEEKLQERFFELYERQLENVNTSIKDKKFGRDKVSLPKPA